MIQNFHYMTLASVVLLCVGTFTSVSVSAISHIFIAVPGIYFTYQQVKRLGPIRYSLRLLSKSNLALLGIVGAIILSVLLAHKSVGADLKNILKIKYFVLALLAIPAWKALFSDENWNRQKLFKVLLWLFLIATTLATLSGLIALGTGFNPLKFKAACHPERACGLYGMYMTYGYGIGLFMTALTALIFKYKDIKHLIPVWALGIAWFINGAGLVLSYTRGGLLAYLISLPFITLKWRPSFFIKICIGSVLVGGILFFTTPKIKNMFLNRAASNQQRIAFYKTAISAFKERPLFGWGYRNFEPNVKELKKKYDIAYPEFGGHAHNNFLEHLASTGFVGLIFMLFFHVFWLIESFKRDDLIGFIAFPFIINFWAGGLVQYTFGDGENLFLIMGMYTLTQLKLAPRESSPSPTHF